MSTARSQPGSVRGGSTDIQKRLIYASASMSFWSAPFRSAVFRLYKTSGSRSSYCLALAAASWNEGSRHRESP